MTDAFREQDMITRKVTAPPGTSLFRCGECKSVAALAGTLWQCAGPKSGRSHDWADMTFADSATPSEVVKSGDLHLRRG
jgi:hypothetical protein